MLMLVGMGNSLGTRNSHGHGFGQNFIPVIGMSFLADVFFLRGYGFGQVIPSVFLPIAISSANHPNPSGELSATPRCASDRNYAKTHIYTMDCPKEKRAPSMTKLGSSSLRSGLSARWKTRETQR
jgi:hypothetical protein